MKKLLGLIAIVLVSATTHAQESEASRTSWMDIVRQVDGLGASVEVGLMGSGINVTVPIVPQRVFVIVGYNLPKFNYHTDVSLSVEEWNRDIDELNNQVTILQTKGRTDYEKVNNFKNKRVTVVADAKIQLSSFKALAQYYPSAVKKLYVTEGVFIGQDENFIDLHGQAASNEQRIYTQALALNEKLEKDPDPDAKGVPGLKDKIRFNIDKTTYGVDENIGFDAEIRINRVRPYVGVGWGESIPMQRRLGWQVELGTWMHGRPEIISPTTRDNYDAKAREIKSVYNVLSRVMFYPQLTVRMTGRIF
ncbi:MAG: hypothetical protein J6W69_00760 [Bacteroidales bacterium]|nr:hypothetical protein [Bacteroidales bacterium]